MRFRVTPYHHNLLMDHQRLSAFYEAISSSARGVTYDLGAGSGVLSYFAAGVSEKVIAVEKDPKIAACASENLSHLENVRVVNQDALEFEFTEPADTIICEMLDTALIDEEQVPVLQRAMDFLKPDGRVIPLGILNAAEPVLMNSDNILYDERGSGSRSAGPLRVYSRVNFKGNLDDRFRGRLKLRATGPFNGIRITTFTILQDDIICGPTPMMNPPLMIPLGSAEEPGEAEIELSYRMGGGLGSIRAEVL